MDNLIHYLLRRFEDLKGQRITFESSWDDICRLIQLSNTTIYDENPKGDNKNASVSFDSTASYAAQRLAAVINSVMTNQASEWFVLETDNDQLNDVKEIKQWLEEATATVRKELENSNFYTELLPLYYDLATIGTGVMYIEEDDSMDNQIRFNTRHIKECYADENKYGEIDTIFRKTKMTARQMVQRWEDDVCEVVKGVMADKPDTEYEVLHCVFPREERDTTKKDKANKRYASVWIDMSNTHLMADNGYDEFPYVMPRWDKLPNEIYGRSPSYIALPDVKTLNAMQETLIKIGQKTAEPPMFVSGDLEADLDMRPAAVNYADSSETQVTPLSLGDNPAIAVDLIQIKIDRILEIYYNNQLQVIQDKKMTAAEVQARTDENWRILGSVFGRLQSELLEKLMNRVFQIVSKSTRMDGSPILPPAPEQLSGATLRLKYVSQLAKAQKQADIMGIINTVGYAAETAQINPNILDNIDFDTAIRELGDLYGAPSTIFMDRQQMQAMRQQRAQQQAQMQQAQQDQAQLQNVKTEAEAADKMVSAKTKLDEAA